MIGRRGLLAAAFALAARPARAGCLLSCDPELWRDAETEAIFVRLLGRPLPPGARVTHGLSGGFQDAFVQVRIAAGPEAVAALLDALGTARAALEPGTGAGFGAAFPDWWPQAETPLLLGDGRLAHFAFTGVALAEGAGSAGDVTIWIFAFET